VFQDYNLIDGLTVFHNIELVLEIQNELTDPASKRKRIEETLSFVGLDGYSDRKVNELSGGQKQRVAIARALAKQSRVILADEPTGNLDSESGKMILSLLKKISKDRLVFVVTHDVLSAHTYGDRIITISDGKITDDIKVENKGENQPVSVTVFDTDNNKVFELNNVPFDEAREKLSVWLLKNEGKHEYSIDIKRLAASEKSIFDSKKEPKGYQIASKSLSFGKKIHMAKLKLGKKKFRLALTVCMFSLTIFLLLMVSFVMTYDRTETIGRYIISQNAKEVYLYKNLKYENLFFETKTNNVSKGEKFVLELQALFPNHTIIPRMKIDSVSLNDGDRYSYAYDVTLAITEKPESLFKTLLSGRYPQNGREVVITDYIAYELLKDKQIVGKFVTVGSTECKVVGIIKTDYEERQIPLKVRRNDLNEFAILICRTYIILR